MFYRILSPTSTASVGEHHLSVPNLRPAVSRIYQSVSSGSGCKKEDSVIRDLLGRTLTFYHLHFVQNIPQTGKFHLFNLIRISL
jgi:hypothetical protein